jgi:AraC-like DNA-binding protein
MKGDLLSIASRYAAIHADSGGVAVTPVAGLTIIQETAPTALQFAINRPLVTLVLQGSKRVTIGSSTFNFGAGESLLITADVPTVSQITRATPATPYYSLVIDLDPSVIADLLVDIGPAPAGSAAPVRVDPTDSEVADAALRLMRLLDRPSAQPVLEGQLVRELHYWLLMGRHGSAIRNLGVAGSHVQRIGRAVGVIRTKFNEPLRVEQLAEAAGMGLSSFHQHFRAITSLTPLQFQKQLRLIEARRRMLSHGEMISNAAYAVGYESVPQFTRDYRRLFGLPPARELKAAKAQMQAA